MNTCPCCTGKLLRHVHRSGIYWFCPHCGQEMPNLPVDRKKQQPQKDELRSVV
ncbi:MAG: hypothetical protein ACLFV6_00090 [Spirulinaceae cyanobacterium]